MRRRAPAAAFLLLPCLFGSCLSFQEVTFNGITDVAVDRVDQNGIVARVTVALDNPNGFRIHVIDPKVDLYLNDVYVGRAVMDSSLVLEKKVKKEYPIPMHATFDAKGAALGAVLTAALTGKATLKAKGTVVGRAFLLRKRFPFEEEHELEWDY